MQRWSKLVGPSYLAGSQQVLRKVCSPGVAPAWMPTRRVRPYSSTSNQLLIGNQACCRPRPWGR